MARRAMKLPHAQHARVEREKVTEYLLNLSHPIGAAKARFFIGLGFDLGAWQSLAEALRQHAHAGEVTSVRETGYGRSYAVAGELETPRGGRPRVCTVWHVDAGAVAPRLVTAYPLEKP